MKALQKLNAVKSSVRVAYVALLASVMSLFAPSAFAFTAPAAGSFGYDIYDIVVVKMLGGPLGWVGAAMLLIWGISNIMKQWLITVVCVVGATCIIKTTTILTSLGFVIN